jgi:hypothetical protein
MNALLLICIGAVFTNPQAVEQALDNSPQAARVAIEANTTQQQANAIETTLVPPPTLEQQEADLKVALSLIQKTTADANKDTAIRAIQDKLDAIEAQKPKPEVVESIEPIEDIG